MQASEGQTVVNEPIYDSISYLILIVIDNELKRWKRLLLLVHADTRFSSPVKDIKARSITVVYRLINNDSFVLFVYRQKVDHVRMDV